jgi:apolipoprotein N-acyltransferase
MTCLGMLRQRRWRKLVALALILTMVGACQVQPAQVGIPLAYGLTGLCLALLISPTLTAAVVGFVVGCVLGAAVYNNSLKFK